MGAYDSGGGGKGRKGGGGRTSGGGAGRYSNVTAAMNRRIFGDMRDWATVTVSGKRGKGKKRGQIDYYLPF